LVDIIYPGLLSFKNPFIQMIVNVFLDIAYAFLEVAKSPLVALSTLIPEAVNTGITTTIAAISTKVNLVYHTIPAADTLWNILLTTIYITAAYFSFRLFVFIWNEIRGSGGKV